MAECLPTALIHRNAPGERVHRLLAELDARGAAHGVRQRLIAKATARRGAGPLPDWPSRWRFGGPTLTWDAVTPHQGP
ncbi:MAG TPA: hypothetical protein VLQ78_04115 [Ornithinibacter sp.]|nr:hypothetical protein [Ornithinibacter sp.]